MEEEKIKIKTVSSMEKVFPDKEPMAVENFRSGLQNERLNFQIAVYNNGLDSIKRNKIEVRGDFAKYVTMRSVEMVPATYFLPMRDDYYLKHEIGVYPDLLKPFGELGLVFRRFQWTSIWVSVDCSLGVPVGRHSIPFVLSNEQGEIIGETEYTIEVIQGYLEPCDLKLTNWVHYDCIAQKHHVKPFTKKFYQIFSEYLKEYVGLGYNTLLTPLFTPPLDTAVGGERLTVQLVKVKISDGDYEFDFSPLKKFIKFCLARGICYIEFSQLFTQWGGEYCPKIVAEIDGEEKRIFGWENSSTSSEYEKFLSTFLPRLVKVIDELKIREKCLFHLTDEPTDGHLENYAKCRHLVKKYIGDMPIMDAMSHYEFYELGLVDIPVAITSSYEKFASHNNIENLFVYYCCSPADGYYSNRHLNMPSHRTRVLGLQLYQTGVQGFLHWGFNFYNSAGSLCEIDPYSVTDAGGMFPSGDSFIVYPTKNGVYGSLRGEMMREAFQDYAALKLLEKKIGKSMAKKMVEEFGVQGFNVYPHSLEAHTQFREQVNTLLKKDRDFIKK